MDVTETKSEGLTREYKVLVPAAVLSEKLDARIDEIRPQMRLKGFRPGKVPASHIRKVFGKSIMGEIVENTVQETSQKALDDAKVRPAAQPQIDLDSEAEKVIAGEADLEYRMQMEVMPDFEPCDVAKLSLERPVTEVADAEVDEALERLAEGNKKYEPREDGAAAETGDAVVVDFVGKIDDEAFEGGTADGQTIVLGDGRFIPGFEDQLIGAKAEDDVVVNVTFPEDYPVDTLKGKDAVFDVKVSEVRAPETPEIDDEFAKGLGLDDLEKLKEVVKQQIESENAGMSRQKLKRVLLDALDEAHDFDLPPGMVDSEFKQIWAQLEQEREADRLDDEDKEKSEEELEADYRKISERRVRLGLVLAEIGRANDVEVQPEEVARALNQEAARYPGSEQQVVEFYQKNPGAMAQLRAPLFEEKVVDYIIERATVTDKTVSRDELFAEDE